jgi:trehalose/maltose hydrolase-like predicted phosphorylase
VAGCYDRLVTEVAGREVENEDLVNLPNWLPLAFRAEGGEWFAPGAADLLAYHQELDLRRGVLSRRLRFRDREGRITAVAQRRFVGMADSHVAGLETTFTAENWSGRLEVHSGLDGTVTNAGVERYRKLNGQHLVPVATGTVGDDVVWLQAETASSRIRVALAARTRVLREDQPDPARRRSRREPGRITHELTLDLREGEPATVEKVVTLFTSRDPAVAEPGLAARERLAGGEGFDALLERHVLAWEQLWRRCRLDIRDGVGETALILDLHLFHLLQTLSPHTADLDVGVPARGLHGEAYRGHVFWDELFVLLHLNPRSGRWLPDHSHLQRHVGIAVAYNVWQYYQATADLVFLSEYGAEMLLEIARFWASVAVYNRTTGRYEIRRVMGPDEYHDAYPDAEQPGLDNNAYTNVMAAWVLLRALDVLDLLPQPRRMELAERLALRHEELERWGDLTRKLHVPFHDGDIISQFDGYEHLDELDWQGYRQRHGDIRRLDRLLEAEGDSTNRYRASKQADVLMLFYLLSADELRGLLEGLGYRLEAGALLRTVEYYLQRTSHGSTLSGVVHAWVLARSDRERSWEFFSEALTSDLHDIQGGTTKEAIHLGAMAGTVDLAQRCYTGMETRDDVLWLDPALPAGLRSLEMEIHYRGHWGVRVEVTREHLRVSLPPSEGAPINVSFRGKVVTIDPGGMWEFPLTG